MSAVRLIWPTEKYLPAYADALRKGWSPDNVRPEAALEELEAIEKPAVYGCEEGFRYRIHLG